MSSTQLSLAHIDIKNETNLKDFTAPSFTPILAAVHDLIYGSTRELFLYGSTGTGKTHLLSAIYSQFLKVHGGAIFLSLGEIIHDDVDILLGIEAFRLIIVDDIHLSAGHKPWQEALFHLINRARNQERKLIFSSTLTPSQLNLDLSDLSTRLSQMLALGLPSGNLPEDRIATLKSILRQKGWQIPDVIFAYLIEEGPYHAKDMLTVLEGITPLFNYRYRGRLPQKLIEEIKIAIKKHSLLVELSDIDLGDDIDLYNHNLSLFD